MEKNAAEGSCSRVRSARSSHSGWIWAADSFLAGGAEIILRLGLISVRLGSAWFGTRPGAEKSSSSRALPSSWAASAGLAIEGAARAIDAQNSMVVVLEEGLTLLDIALATM